MSFLSASRLVLSLSLLGLLVACGGGASNPAPVSTASTGLSYTNPTGTGWRLMKDATSTPTRLVLNLVGPEGAKGRGVGFNLRADAMVKFAKFANGTYINDLGIFKMGNKAGAISIYGEAVTKDTGTIVGGVKEGGRVLTVGAFQKDRRWPAQDLGQPLFQVAIEFDSAVAASRPGGTEIPLTFLRARSIPEYIGDNPEDPYGNRLTWYYDYKIDDVTVAVGKLVTAGQ